MVSGRVGQALRSAAVFILLIVLGDSAMTSVRSKEVARPDYQFATVLERAASEPTTIAAPVEMALHN